MVTLNSERVATLGFGAYELDLQAGVLRKDGIRLRCQDQPLQVLAALAEKPGELVTREELRRRVWPQDTFVDFDHALNTAVKKIRRLNMRILLTLGQPRGTRGRRPPGSNAPPVIHRGGGF